MIHKNTTIFLLGIALALGMFLPLSFALEPSGANVTQLNTSTAPADAATSNNAIAGNVTEVSIQGFTTTQAWQGYFGNVTGVIQLADGSDNVFYNWSQASPRGEVYASTNSTVYWSNVQCFNFTATGAFTVETGNGGTTNLYGFNLSRIHADFGISDSDPDSVNATFTFLGAGTHDEFFTASQQFTEGECRSTRIFDNTGAVSNRFEEVLLYEPLSRSIVFASLLEQDLTGFNGRTHDFQMLVLENGHGTNVASTPYYFFVELQ